MKNKIYPIGIVILVGIIIIFNSAFIVNETEQVIITQFKKPVGGPITTPGLKFKIPFIQATHFFDKRILEWDGEPNEVPTAGKEFIWVDTFARWKIVDPLQFFLRVQAESRAHQRLDAIINSITRDQITANPLIDVVRNSNRPLTMTAAELQEKLATSLDSVRSGREQISREILRLASEQVTDFGIELIDVQIKRVNYTERVRETVYDRMISERKRIAEKFRAEGQGSRAEIEGRREREYQRITSEAYRTAQEIKGRADAASTKIYAEAYNRDPEFYSFLNTLENYRTTMKANSRLIISTDSDFYKYLRRASGN